MILALKVLYYGYFILFTNAILLGLLLGSAVKEARQVKLKFLKFVE
jgi:hypothetical protein